MDRGFTAEAMSAGGEDLQAQPRDGGDGNIERWNGNIAMYRGTHRTWWLNCFANLNSFRFGIRNYSAIIIIGSQSGKRRLVCR